MKDGYGREINYIRISLTDRCNLRCVYCMPHGTQLVPREEILRQQEIVRVVRAAAGLGINRVKVTGGEPLVRRCCVDLIRELKQVPGIDNVTLTTNGILLKDHLEALKDAGIDGINVSLDTADPGQYRELTGGGDVSKTIDAINASVRAGIDDQCGRSRRGLGQRASVCPGPSGGRPVYRDDAHRLRKPVHPVR